MFDLPQAAHDAYWRVKETGEPPPFDSLSPKLQQCWAAAAHAAAAAERERIRQLATRASAIYPLPLPYPAITVNGERAGDTQGNVVLWPDGMPATAPFASLLTEGDTT